MTKLKDKVKYALDEGRLLILGAQVLLGIQYRAAFESGFEKLPAHSQYLKLAGLCLLLITLALLIWPGAYHRIVERGEDTDNVHQFTTRVMELALLPFAAALGIELFISAERIVGTEAGIIVGGIAAALALVFWYGIEALAVRRQTESEAMRRERHEPSRTKLSDRVDHVLTEARMVLPGAQALLGFQLVTILMDGFDKLPDSSKYAHLISLCLIATTIVLLMTPAAYHRIVEKGRESEGFHKLASRFLLAAMVPLALGVSGDFFVVIRKITESLSLALIGAGLLLALCYGFWFGLTTYWRSSRERGEGWLSGDQRQPTAG